MSVLAFGRSEHRVGPFDVELFVRPGSGISEIALPPLGRVQADTHLSPVRMSATLAELDPDAVGELIRRRGLRSLVEAVQRDAGSALRSHALRILLVAAAGLLAGALLVHRGRWRAVGHTAVAGLAVVTLLAAGVVASYEDDAFLQARYTGSLRAARDLVGPLSSAGTRFAGFRGELDRLVRGTVRAYGVLDQAPEEGAVALLHVSDIHASPLGMDLAQQLASEFQVAAVVDTGDLVTFGSSLEETVVDRVPEFGVPYVFVRGNHDPAAVARRIERSENGETLESEAVTVAGIRIFGAPHPLFTPGGPMEEHEAVAEAVAAAGVELAERVAAEAVTPDIVLVHDGRMADALAGRVPLVLSGHFHAFDASVEQGTIRLRTGTTGGGGLDTFTADAPVPLAAQVLYLSGTPPRLTAIDRVALDPETREITVARELVETPAPAAVPSPTS